MSGFLENYVKEGHIFSPLKEFPLTKYQKLFKLFAKEFSGGNSNIVSFNNWVTKILPKQVEKKSFIAPDGTKVIFEDVFLNSPKKIVNKKETLIYPYYCRSRKYPYVGRLTATCVTIKPDGTKKSMENITLGSIPIMLGSVKCNLHGKTKEELVELGECISDPFGYFITSSERTVIIIDKTSINIPVIRIDKESAKHIIVKNYNPRRRIVLKTGKKWNSILMNDPLDDMTWKEEGAEARTFPLFLIYKVLLDVEPEKIVSDYILPFFKESLHHRVRNVLTETLIEYKSIRNPYRYLYVIQNQEKRANFTEDIEKEIREKLESEFYVEVFDHIKPYRERVKAKLISLSFIVSRYLSFFIGETKAADINSWQYKRFETPAVSMEILFEAIFNKVIERCKKTQEGGSIDYSAFGLKLRNKSEGIMKNDFEHSFNTENWGVHGTKFNRGNHAENTLRDTPLQLWSNIDKNNVNGASVRDINRKPREVQPSQRNRHCVIETPESEQIGYVKHSAITNIYSINRDKEEIGKIIDSVCHPQDDEHYILITLNGIAFVRDDILLYGNEKTRDNLLKLRRKGILPLDVEIYKFPDINVIDIQCNSSRALAPHLIVNRKSGKLVVDEKEAWNWSVQKLLKNGCIEFLSPREEESQENTIAVTPEHFYKTRKLIESSSAVMGEHHKNIYDYTHANIDPNQMFSVTGSICPFANHQLAPRTIFQAGMAKQALSFYNINYHLLFPTTAKRLYKATRPFSETMTYSIPSLDLFPSGQTAIVAFYCMPDNQEDSVVISEDYVNAGNLNFITYKTIKYRQPTQIAGAMEKFQRPPIRENEDPGTYKNIEDNGFPRIDSYIRKGDCVIGKVLIKKEGVFNNSVYAQMDEEGYVEGIEITRENDGQQILVKIRLARHRKYQAGDKLALRYAQKGTVGRVVTRRELLRIATGPNKGIYPDIVFNPHSFPSRQTVGLPFESVVDKVALWTGERVNVSSFQDYDREYFQNVLQENGMDPGGYEDMETYDGKRIPKKIAVGPLYEQVLRHQVEDKTQMRDIGNKNSYTHQPIGGRSTGSGIRIGEMEKDSFIGHGASSVQEERLMKSSDEFRLIVCGTCGTIVDNEVCTGCDKSDPGRVYIPYTFKLLIQLLNGAGIKIRINTKRVM
jgi:DNA-directed RNA polymerase II subunit RPB2